MADTAALHRDMFQSVNDRDFKKLRDLYHAEYTYMGGDGAEQKGADAGVAVAETYTSAFPDVTLEIRNQYTSGDDVSIIEFTARGTHEGQLEDIPPTGKKVEIFVCNIIEARDGKILREREYFDQMSMLQQLGVAG